MGQCEKMLAAMKNMNSVAKKDYPSDPWLYCNITKKKSRSFALAVKQKNHKINCVDGPQWAALSAGVPSSALGWYCANGSIVWTSQSARADAKKYFDFIRVGNKTVAQCQKSGLLLPGDILGYMSMTHTNAYYAKNKSFDSGHAYASPKSGEGARIKKFIGSLQCKSMKVSYIIRLKSRIRYRVQCGAFTDSCKAEQAEKLLAAAGFKTMRILEDSMIKLQAGLYDFKDNAEAYAHQIAKKGFSVIVKEVDS